MNEERIPEEIAFVDFRCPHCGNPCSFPESWIGRAQECPTCWQILIVPGKGVDLGAKLPLPYKTLRLLLRRLLPMDSSDLLEIASDKDLLRYVEWDPIDAQQEVDEWLANDREARLFQQKHNFYMALELLGQPKVIGYVALAYLNSDNSEMYTNLIVNRAYHRQGFGTESVRGAMYLAFKCLNIRRLCAWCDCRNIAAARMFEKAGLRREGRFIKERFYKGEWVDSFQFALLKEEYVSASYQFPGAAAD